MYVPFVLFVSLSVKSGEPFKSFSIYLPTNLTYMYVQKSTLPLVIAPFAISFEFLLTLWQIFTKFAIFAKFTIFVLRPSLCFFSEGEGTSLHRLPKAPSPSHLNISQTFTNFRQIRYFRQSVHFLEYLTVLVVGISAQLHSYGDRLLEGA